MKHVTVEIIGCSLSATMECLKEYYTISKTDK